MLLNSLVRALRRPRAVRSGTVPCTLAIILVLGLAGCAPQTTTQLPPATSLAVTAAPPATAAPPTPVPQPTATPPPTQAAEPVGDADFLLTILHTNDVAGETDPCG